MTERQPRQAALPGIGRGGRVARVRRAVDHQLRAQRALGHIEPLDDGLIGVARTLADALDEEWTDPAGSRYVVGALAGRLVPVLLELRGERRDSAGDVGYDEELARIAAEIRDAARYATPRDPDRPTIGTTTLAHLARLRRAAPYPWQWDVAEVAGELNDTVDGFRYPVVLLGVPRRAGKTTLNLAANLDRLDLIPDARCWYTAQAREVAAKLFRDEWAPMLDPPRSPVQAAQIARL